MMLTTHVAALTQECRNMDATVSSLNLVRDAIHVIGVCPGLGRINFITPVWYSSVWVSSIGGGGGGMLEMHIKDIVDLVGLSDPDIDRHLDGMCKSVNATWRAVETS